jgi:hypothetical protein
MGLFGLVLVLVWDFGSGQCINNYKLRHCERELQGADDSSTQSTESGATMRRGVYLAGTLR